MARDMVFHQLYESESSTYTYILADADTREAIIIDSVIEKAERDWKLLQELELKLLYILDTHVHADHITGAATLRKLSGAKTCVSQAAGIPCADVQLKEGHELRFGAHTLKAIGTPGHTDSCMSFIVGNRVFTGDALMIRAVGRTDFQQGSPEKLYASLTQKLFKLPAEMLVYPAHNYIGLDHSTIATEMRHNARIGGQQSLKSQEEFAKIMNGLNLPPPKKLAEALPANMRCGQVDP